MSETEKLFKESKYQSYKFKKYFKVYDELFSLYKNKKIKLGGSEEYYNTTLSIPIFHTLNTKKQDKVIKIIKNFFKKF